MAALTIKKKKITLTITIGLCILLIIGGLMGIFYTQEEYYLIRVSDLLFNDVYTQSEAFQDKFISDSQEALQYAYYSKLLMDDKGKPVLDKVIFKGRSYIEDYDESIGEIVYRFTGDEVEYTLGSLLKLGTHYGLYLDKSEINNNVTPFRSYDTSDEKDYRDLIDNSIYVTNSLFEDYSESQEYEYYKGIDQPGVFLSTEDLCNQLFDTLNLVNKTSQNLKEDSNFKVYLRLENAASGSAIYSNIEASDVASIQELDVYMEYSSAYTSMDGKGVDSNKKSNLTSFLSKIEFDDMADNYYFIAGVDTSFSVVDQYQDDYTAYQNARKILMLSIILFIIGSVLLIVQSAFTIRLLGRRDGTDGIHLIFFDKWYPELALFFLIIVYTIGHYFTSNFLFSWTHLELLVRLILLTILLVWGVLSLIRRVKAKILWNKSLTNKLLRGFTNIFKSMSESRPAVAILLAIIGYFVVNVWLGFLLIHMFRSIYDRFAFATFLGVFLCWIGFNVFCIGFVLQTVIQRKKILLGVRKIAEGDLSYKIDVSKMHMDDKELAIGVNNIASGLQIALTKSIKSERMKTDLLTNVSHDIKTPLTSIINYVDLLKRENIDNDRVKNYIQVLEEKSSRLKTLTEDIMEISKASSGNLHLDLTTINFVELISQTNGEFAEKFADKNLSVIMSTPETPLYIKADGRQMWRILENLYNNAYKYAMENTRVYIDIFEHNQHVWFSIKNISKAPITYESHELMERFVRGDVARTSEGSGLGLSIAKTMTEIQRGNFEVYLDGDLFRVSIIFPKER